MLFLSVDTSGKPGSVTLAEGSHDSFRVIESSVIAGGTFSAQLVPTLACLLQKHGFTAGDLAGFVVVSGPGSFTGLRVGLSAIKGLAEGLNRSIATVSLLEALAIFSGLQGRVAAALDAGRDELFWALYNVANERALLVEERLLSRVEFVEGVRDPGSPPLVTSDQSSLELARSAGAVTRKVERPKSETVASIGLRKLLNGETVGIEEVDATYIRRSDAEIFSRSEPRRS
jgi:tRNA threonylcarbamoyladenosine biosynthesis protein TsaB